jgi:hypothetical protein
LGLALHGIYFVLGLDRTGLGKAKEFHGICYFIIHAERVLQCAPKRKRGSQYKEKHDGEELSISGIFDLTIATSTNACLHRDIGNQRTAVNMQEYSRIGYLTRNPYVTTAEPNKVADGPVQSAAAALAICNR